MSQDAERVKKLVEFKGKLEKRIEELETELRDTQVILETVRIILLEKGFRRVEIAEPERLSLSREEAGVKPELSVEPEALSEDVVPLKTATGEMLAILHTTQNTLRALPAEGKSFNINTPPFSQFLVERVLAKMQERDNELARNGQLSPSKIFSYTIVREGDTIQEIIAENIDSDRLRELKSSIRWTLEKMYEKMKTQNQE